MNRLALALLDETTCCGSVSCPSPVQPMKVRKKRRIQEPLEDDQEISDLAERMLNPDNDGESAEGFELSDRDMEALRTIESGRQATEAEMAWLEECGLVKDGTITSLGKSLI